mmetsp:Transcript_97942/g.204299  ORF Transcript_97942/g.204299 Transcript_97942/m.204299 type:complete len:220 (-) Transcript_97942:7-666(-)
MASPSPNYNSGYAIQIDHERDYLQDANRSMQERFYGTVERLRRANGEKRRELEALLAEAEEDLENHHDAVRSLYAEIQYEQLQGSNEANGGLVGAWPEVERVAAAARNLDEKILEVRRLQRDQTESEQRSLEERSSLYQVFAEATGIHWDDVSEGVAGYIAHDDQLRHFDFGHAQTMSKKACADELWNEVAACLPEGGLFDFDADEILTAVGPAESETH